MKRVMNTNGAVGHGDGSPISGGVFVITSAPDAKAKIDNAGIHVTPLAYSFSGGSASGFVTGSVSGAGTIVSTASKVKVGGKLIIRLEDSGTMSAAGTLTGGGSGSISGPVEIIDAGQSKVKAD
jgi:hypothetical protein